MDAAEDVMHFQPRGGGLSWASSHTRQRHREAAPGMQQLHVTLLAMGMSVSLSLARPSIFPLAMQRLPAHPAPWMEVVIKFQHYSKGDILTELPDI